MKISPLKKQDIQQKFIFCSEAQWEKAKPDYDKSVASFFEAKSGEVFITFEDDLPVFLIGTGDKTKTFQLQQAASKFSREFRKKFKEVPTSINSGDFSQEEIQALVTGLLSGTYDYPFRKEHPFFNKNFELIIDTDTSHLKELKLRANSICEGQFACMEWLNKPQNFKRVDHISAFLKDTAEKYQLKLTVLDRKKSEKAGLGAFLSVNQGSSQEAAFTVLEYNCGRKNAKTVGLVGKCVLFDTGGISIKPSDNMHYMKSDMGGATAVIGTLIAAAEMKIPVNITAVLPITDNAVSNTAYIPSDVITAYNGKTIEVLNTDAEGRMTLADGLSYLAKNYKTDAMIDLATLTGSSVRMFGNTCGALFSNDEKLTVLLQESGDRTNERLWNMPLWDVWKEEFSSDVADFKNISLKPVGDCIVAAKFLEQFIEGHQSWAHLDIAGVAFGNTQYSKEKAATGYGVQLLIDFLENFS